MAAGDLLPTPKSPRLHPMTVAAAEAWLTSYNAYAARMRAYTASPTPELLEQPRWADGSDYSDSAVPRSCLCFSVMSRRWPLGYIRLSGGFDNHFYGSIPDHADPSLIVWAGWRKHPLWDGTEPMPGEPGHLVAAGRRLLVSFSRGGEA